MEPNGWSSNSKWKKKQDFKTMARCILCLYDILANVKLQGQEMGLALQALESMAGEL